MKTETQTISNVNVISGIMLLAGTCIGAGMLAQPVVTGVSGFLPSIMVNFVCWLVMLCTGLLFLEATLWMKKGSNLISMATRFLGPIGKWVGGAAFLLLYYCLEVSYMAAGAPIFGSLLSKFGLHFSESTSFFLFASLFGVIVYFGTHAINRINWILMFGLVFSYLLLTGAGSFEVQSKLLQYHDWKLSFLAAPTLFAAYGYHNIIPTLSGYMKQNAPLLRITIIIGTAIPFIIYSVWQWMIIGIVPQETLLSAAELGTPINQVLQQVTTSPFIGTMSAFFGFFALVTSLIGVSLSMVDFLADGMKASNQGVSRLVLCLIIFIPSALFAAHNPHIFIKAIGFAGGYGEAILNGIFPVAMVWVGRYVMKLPSSSRLPGGKVTLSLLFIFIVSIILLETILLTIQ